MPPPASPGPRSVTDHRETVAALLEPTGVELVDLAQAHHRVLAADLVSAVALPPFDNSAMDGYAVRRADLRGADPQHPVVLPVAHDVPAGRIDSPPLRPGTVHRIMTGAPVPAGADAVLPVEQTDGGVARVALYAEPQPGAHLRRRGEDVAAGQVVLSAGAVLSASRVGLAAAIGMAQLPVRRRPVVLVLSTGSELVAPGTALRHGQIYESNGPMLAAAVTEAGAVAELLHFVPDDAAALLARLTARLATGPVDLVLTSGGVSAGAYEVVKDAFTGRGVRFGKVAMQPGGPQGAGRVAELGGVGVVALPGNPVSSQVSFEVFVRPALRASMGFPDPHRRVETATLGERWTSPSGRTQFRRGVFDRAAGVVREVGGPASHLLAALAVADCLVVVPEAVTELPAGSSVRLGVLDATFGGMTPLEL